MTVQPTSPRPQDGSVTVVIVSYNTRDLLRECLRSLRAQGDGEPVRTVVVDNASSDDSATLVREEFPWVTLIANPTNRGFAAANNQAFPLCMSEFILCLNPDTVLHEHALSASVHELSHIPDVAVLGCRIENPDGTLQLSARLFPSMWSLVTEMTGMYKVVPATGGILNPWMSPQERTIDVDIVKGAFFLMRGRALDEIGMFDEEFELYSEEADWCRRARDAGWRVVLFPGATMTHAEGSSSGIERGSPKYLLLESEMLYYRKHHGRAYAVAAMALWWTGAVLRSCAWAVLHLIAMVGAGDPHHTRMRLRYYVLLAEWIVLRPFRGPSRLVQ